MNPYYRNYLLVSLKHLPINEQPKVAVTLILDFIASGEIGRAREVLAATDETAFMDYIYSLTPRNPAFAADVAKIIDLLIDRILERVHGGHHLVML